MNATANHGQESFSCSTPDSQSFERVCTPSETPLKLGPAERIDEDCFVGTPLQRNNFFCTSLDEPRGGGQSSPGIFDGPVFWRILDRNQSVQVIEDFESGKRETIYYRALFIVTSSFLLLVVRPGAPLIASLLLVAMPFVTNSFLLLVAMAST